MALVNSNNAADQDFGTAINAAQPIPPRGSIHFEPQASDWDDIGVGI